jgi:hypothetical protein
MPNRVALRIDVLEQAYHLIEIKAIRLILKALY